MNIFNSNTLLDNFIIENCKKNIDEYSLNLTNLFQEYNKYNYYSNMFLFIIYKENKIYTIFNDGDTRKNLYNRKNKNHFLFIYTKFYYKFYNKIILKYL